MCKIISGTIDSRVDRAAFELAVEGRYRFEGEAKVAPQLPDGRLYFIYAGHCNCGSAPGSGAKKLDPPYTDLEMRRMAAKTTDPDKLERWRQKKISAYEAKRLQHRRWDEAAEWLLFLGRLLSLSNVNVVGLMHHFYGSEEFRVSIATVISLWEAEPEDILDLPPDTLQEFTR